MVYKATVDFISKTGYHGSIEHKKVLYVQYLCTEKVSLKVSWGSELRKNVLARASNSLTISQSVLSPIILLNKILTLFKLVIT
jgi:hypothetical protein